MNLPEIVPRKEWVAARKPLLAQEKEFTHAKGPAGLRTAPTPMVRIDKKYVLDGPNGTVTRSDTGASRRTP